MNISITTSRLAGLVTTYGHSLDTFFNGDKLKSILSPEDVYLHWQYSVGARLSDASPEWLKEVINFTLPNFNYNYVSSALPEGSIGKTLYGGNFKTVITSPTNILIIMDTSELRQLSDISSIRGLMDTLVITTGIENVNIDLLSLYVSVAGMKPII